MNSPLVIVSSSFPIHGDGSEAAGAFVADLVADLSKRVRVHVVAPGSVAGRERWSDQVEVFRYAAPSRPLSTLKPWIASDLAWIARVLYGGLTMTRAASAGGAFHIVALWGLPCGEWARRVARESKINYSVWMLGSDVWSLGRVPVLRAMLARVMRQAAHSYADGYKLAEDAKRIGQVPVEFLPSTRCMDVTAPLPPRMKPPYRFLFLGRWHQNKGIDLLLDALLLLNDDDWRLIESVEIQGGGPMETLVRERVGALHVKGRPVILGRFLAKEEAEAAILRADWLLIPSRIESIPVVFSDAIKLGRPVMATPVGDLPRLINQGCGIICEAANASSIAEALRVVVQGSSLFSPAKLNEIALTFSLERISMKLINGADGVGSIE